VPEDKAVLALRSLVRAAAEATAEATASELARELVAAATSGAGLAKKQSNVFDPRGGM
jgi:ribosomal protein S7